jgi:hypothetical protein
MFIHVTHAAEEGKLIKTCSDINTCREFFNASMRKKYLSGYKRFKTIDTSRAYVVYTYGRCHKKINQQRWDWVLGCAKRSLKVLNSFERKYKWYPLTRIYPVDDDRDTHSVPSVLFIGPAKWTMSPYLFNIYTLIVRIGRNLWIDEKIYDLDHEEMVKRLYERAYDKRGIGGDAIQIYRSIKLWELLMAHYKELFGDKTRADNWSLEHLSNQGGHRIEGIVRLAMGTAYNKDLLDQIRKIKRKEARKNGKKEAVHSRRKN